MRVPSSSIPLSSSGDKPLIQPVEVLRVAAITGVVWFHLENAPFPAIGQAGLIAFVMICTLFQSVAASTDPLWRFLRRRAVRIVPPWLVWSAIYGVINLLRHQEWFPWSSDWVSNVLTGPWIGLWFLPFVLLSAPVVFVLTRLAIPGQPEATIPLLLCLAGLLLLTAAWLPLLHPLVTPWAQWLHASPAIPLAIALRQSQSAGLSRGAFRPSVIGAIWLGLCIPILWIHPGTATSHAIGALATTAAYSWSLPLPHFLSKPGQLCLGVYLIHPLVIAVFKLVPFLKSQPLALLVVAVPTCFWLVHRLRRYAILRSVL